jgi:hypothetical protein
MQTEGLRTQIPAQGDPHRIMQSGNGILRLAMAPEPGATSILP